MSMFEPTAGPDPFLTGVQAGLARARRHDLRSHIDAPTAALPEIRAEVETALESPLRFTRGLLAREEDSARFTELFAEMLTVAVIARQTYDDAPLSETEIESYHRQSASIFNSFRHA